MALNFAKDDLEFLLSVADVLLIDKNGNQLASATLKSHNMSQTVDSTEIRAGQAYNVLATIKNNKKIEVTIEDVQQKHDFIAMMLGSEIKKGVKVDAYVLPQSVTVKEGKITLPQIPKEGEEVVVTKADGSVVKTTFTDAESEELLGVKEGDLLYISGYKYVSTVDNMVMEIASDRYAGSYRMVMDEQVFNADMQIIARKQTVFNKVKLLRMLGN